MPAAPTPLSPDRLYRVTDPDHLDFTTTAEIAQLPGLIHQTRAREAIGFGTCISQPGFNIFAVGDTAGRVRDSVRLMLDEAALGQPSPPDWVYVYNFADPQRPKALSLPAGRAPALQKMVHDLIEELKAALPAVFESEDYQKQRGALEQAIQAKGQTAFAALNEKAQTQNIAILRTPAGFTMAPIRDGKIVPPEDFNAWSREEQLAAQQAIGALEKDLEDTLRTMPRLEKERRDAVLALERETARTAIEHPVNFVKAALANLPDVLAHIEEITKDLLENAHLFAAPQEAAADPTAATRLGGALERFEVNVMVTQAGNGSDAPVVEELNPTLANLVGRVEYLQVQGALVTNFRFIKAGALHRANGGTLLLDVRALLTEPYSWPALKRALTRGEIVIEDVTRFVGVTTTVSLEPDPIPLNVKIVLFGDRMLYYMLSGADPDLSRHFKVLADFDDEFERTGDNELMLARMIGSMAQQEHLKPLDRDAVARVIEHAARIADDQQRLTLRVDLIRDLLTEVSHWAGVAGRKLATREDVEHAIDQQIFRVSRIRELGKSMILRDIALIDTKGTQVGQVNGLSVMSLGGYSFGKPTRITCSVRPGAGRIIDIEREVDLGGPTHSKGVLILSGYLTARFGQEIPLSLNASLVFEQSYGGVDGDSASSTELYALLSALSLLPLRQDIAVTGSVNQLGVVQAIGGVNEKIEGYFDICAARGLTGSQGVMIPASNVQHLMLRADVIEACKRGDFSIWPIETIDQGIGLLTGHPVGERGADGRFPAGTINRAVVDRLQAFMKVRKEAEADTDEEKTVTRFRRLVLELGHGAADPQTIREAAGFARLLDAELVALFVEDETLLHASALPFAREISPLSYQWRPLEVGRLQAELKSAADQARRHLETAAHDAGIRRSFEVRRGDVALNVTDICVASDIVVVSPPRRMGTGATREFLQLRQSACQSVASVLHLPPKPGRHKGLIAAIAASATDPSLEVARWIATEAHERLIVLTPIGSVVEGEPDVRLLPGTSVQEVISALGNSQERLIVMTRALDAEDTGPALAAARGVPVLVTEPI